MAAQAEAFEKYAIGMSKAIAETLDQFEWSSGERAMETYIMERIGFHLGVRFYGNDGFAAAFFREGLKGAERADRIYE